MGPDIDPEGWKVLPFTIKGKLFNARDIEVGCTVSPHTTIDRTTSEVSFQLAIASPVTFLICLFVLKLLTDLS